MHSWHSRWRRCQPPADAGSCRACNNQTTGHKKEWRVSRLIAGRVFAACALRDAFQNRPMPILAPSRKETILARAEQHFADHGFQGASLSAIARDCEVGNP